MKKQIIIGFIISTCLFNKVWSFDHNVIIEPSPELAYDLQEAIIKAKPNTLIELPEGHFTFSDEITITASHLTLRGAGMDKTILSFKGQPSGAQGVLALGNAITVEDLAIEDTAGDGLRIEGADGVVIRRTRVEWTNGPDEFNGAYGLYPVLSQNVLIEDSIVKGASDAGIYVGQSENIIVRRNQVEYNVAGIEIENSLHADVYENVAKYNTGGILVFDLPNLSQQGSFTRVYNNIIEDNNTENFAPQGNIVANVPSGTGVMILATDNVDVFDNQISGNKTTGVLIASYVALAVIDDLPIPDGYDPYPEYINIRDNTIRRPLGFYFDDTDVNNLLNIAHYLAFLPVPEVVFDGILADGADSAEICLQRNRRIIFEPKFSNLQLDGESSWVGDLIGIPGGPILTDKRPYRCQNDEFAGADIKPFPPIPPADDDFTDEEVAELCSRPGDGVNWDAMVVNCPDLADYRLFADAADPTANANDGFPYDLTTPLFSDYTNKYRFIFLPPGTQMDYNPSLPFTFPVGAVITKTFAIQENLSDNASQETLLETRLLIRRENGWASLPYIWDTAQSKALLGLGGGRKDIVFTDFDGNEKETAYAIPNANQCASCHARSGEVFPIGPKARLLNKRSPYISATESEPNVNQLALMASRQLLRDLPDINDIPYTAVWNDPSTGNLEQRAKAYLDVNCAHCHSQTGRAFGTGLFLNEEQPVDVRYGLCKGPVAAGRGSGGLAFDIAPGEPLESILFFRLDSIDPAIRMPELGRTLIHGEGLELIRDWITSLDQVCEAPQ